MIFLFQDQPYGDTGGAAGAAFGAGFMLVGLAFTLLILAFMWWKVFVKAGKPGWASIIPIYNLFVLSEIAGKPAWWGILLCIPGLGFIFFIIVSIALAKKFGKDTLYGLGLAFLGIIFFPILGFGSATYDPNAAT